MAVVLSSQLRVLEAEELAGVLDRVHGPAPVRNLVRPFVAEFTQVWRSIEPFDQLLRVVPEDLEELDEATLAVVNDKILLVIIALITNEYYQSSLISTQYSF